MFAKRLKIITIFSYIIASISNSLNAQIYLSLNEAVELTQKQSLYFHQAKNSYESSYWKYKNFKAIFRPQIRLSGTIPTFYREINPIVQPDGSILFQKVSQANNEIGLKVRQLIPLTGGTLNIGTYMHRTDNFLVPGSSYFLSTPFSISYNQNSLLYNETKWIKKLEPLYYKNAEKKFTTEIEASALEGATLFLKALMTQNEAEIVFKTMSLADTLLKLSKERYAMGTVSKSDLLQLELNLIKAKNLYNDACFNHNYASINLKRVLGISLNDSLIMTTPKIPNYYKETSPTIALKEATFNRAELIEFKLRETLSEQQIAKARGENSIVFSLLANIGAQQTSSNLYSAYQNLQNQQYIGINFDIPIQDWGYRKSQIRLAIANKELVEVNIRQDQLKFEQEIYLQTMQFNRKFNQVLLSQKADTISTQRLAITKERYLLGKVSVTDLNFALEENISSKRESINALNNFWLAYYELRKLTLYDFINNKKISYSNILAFE